MHDNVFSAMSLYSIVLLAAISLLACGDITSAAASSSTITQTTPTGMHLFDDYYQNDVPTKRFLRALVATDVAGEERAGIDKVANYIKSGTSKFVGSVKLQSYVLRKKSGVQVMNKLQFGDDAAAALTSKKLEELETYITMYNKAFSNNKISMIETLTTRYKDDALARALVKVQREVAGSDEKVTKMVTQLREDQREFWFKNTKSANDVFDRLKIADDGYAALNGKRMAALDDYIKFLNDKKSAQVTLLDTLMVGFGGEAQLIRILSHGKRDPYTVMKALALQDDLLAKWQTNGVHPETVLTRLQLNLNADNLKIVVKYISDFNTKNPTMRVSKLDTLTAHYEDDVVAVALASAKFTPGTRTIATKLQAQQCESWLRSGKSVDYAFKTLGINADDVRFGPISKLDALDEYIKFFNAKNPREKTTMLEALSKGFGGEDKFALLVAKAVEGRLTPADIRAAASKYQGELFRQWKNNDLDPMSVLIQVFKVDETKLASAGAQEKAIIAQYRKFYVSKTDVLDQVPYDIVRPKRL